MLRLAHLRNVLTKSFTCAVQRSGASNKETITPIVYTFPQRAFSLTNTTLCDAHEEDQDGEKKSKNKSYRAKYGGTERDRSRQIPVEESIEYINSSAFKAAYGDKLPWELYRRVHKGQLPKARTRKSCIIQNVVAIGSPCPICRDEYLVLHHTNLDLLRMFISPYTGQVLRTDKSGLCRRQNLKLLVCVERAYDLGLLEHDVPFREYDYNDYYDINRN